MNNPELVKPVSPGLLKWARERANLSLEKAVVKIPAYRDWEEGKSQPTLQQLKAIAKKLHVPFGYLFLSNPPEEKLPIPDFRTVANRKLAKPSVNLLETIYDAQRKQSWLREKKMQDNEGKLILKANYTDQEVIDGVKTLLNIEALRDANRTYGDFLSALIQGLDDKGFLVIRNGVVGNNTHRPLNTEEFKGFALFDEYAPVIFINGKDYKSSQIFTLVHELVHLLLNESALNGGAPQTERKYNRLAAEILLPSAALNDFQLNNIEALAKSFKVSVFVVLIKARQLGLITENEFQDEQESYAKNISEQAQGSSGQGGDYYRNIKFRAGGESFLFRVITSTLAGEILYRDAYSLTGLSEYTFNEYCKKQGFAE